MRSVGSYVGAEELFSFAHDTLNCTYLDPEHDVDLAPLVLGSQSQGLTVVELAGAYSIFNDGKFTTPHYWTEIYDSDGNLYLDNSKRVTTVQAIDPAAATIMNRLLSNVWKKPGTANGMKPETEGIDTIGKTGTTSDFKDYTFAGVSPYYSTAVWWGYDKPYSMWGVDGTLGNNGKPTQRAFKRYMEAARPISLPRTSIMMTPLCRSSSAPPPVRSYPAVVRPATIPRTTCRMTATPP